MAKRKRFSGLRDQEPGKLGLIIFKANNRDIQVSETWALGEKLFKFKDNFVKTKAGNLYTYFVKVRKCA